MGFWQYSSSPLASQTLSSRLSAGARRWRARLHVSGEVEQLHLLAAARPGEALQRIGEKPTPIESMESYRSQNLLRLMIELLPQGVSEQKMKDTGSPPPMCALYSPTRHFSADQ
jgi:hypothetical protein